MMIQKIKPEFGPTNTLSQFRAAHKGEFKLWISGAEWANRLEERTLPITMETFLPKIGTKFKDRVRQD
jgi:hypothetical protein